MGARDYLPGQWPKTCACGQAHSKEAWAELNECGVMGLRTPLPHLELRDCYCRSTLGVEFWPASYTAAEIAEGEAVLAEEEPLNAPPAREPRSFAEELSGLGLVQIARDLRGGP